ncbi:MAG: DUF1573 domain-containing protein [Fibrobacterota bacterium]
MRPLLFLVFSLWALPGTLCSAPRILFDKDLLDMGVLVQGDVMRRSFTFSNTGDAALQISKVKASCGCTAASVDHSRVKPGGSGTLFITFESAKFPGIHRKTVTVLSNDPENPQATVAFTVEVREAWSVTPPHFTFNASKDGLSTNEPFVAFEMTNKHTSAIRRVSLSSPSAEISFDQVFPVTNAGLKTGSVFRAQVFARLKGKVEETRYTWVDVQTEFDDGRKLEKKIGVSIKKCR